MGIIKVEILKLMRKTSSKVLLLIYGIVFSIGCHIYIGAERVWDLSLYSGLQFSSAALSMLMGFLLPFIVMYLGAGIHSLDFINGSIKNMYLLPISRSKLYLGKLVAVQLVIAALLLGQFLLGLMVSLIVEGFVMAGLGTLITEFLGAFIVLGLVNLVANALVLLVKNMGLTLIIGYGAFILLTLLSAYSPFFDTISITSIISGYGQLFNVRAINLLLSSFAYYIILFIAGLLLFEKKEESLCQFD